MAMACLVAALHPDRVIVGGESVAAIQILAEEMESAIQDRTLPEIAASVKVLRGNLSPPLGLIGAGLMVFEKAISQVKFYQN